jgi:hypothetical protein
VFECLTNGTPIQYDDITFIAYREQCQKSSLQNIPSITDGYTAHRMNEMYLFERMSRFYDVELCKTVDIPSYIFPTTQDSIINDNINTIDTIPTFNNHTTITPPVNVEFGCAVVTMTRYSGSSKCVISEPVHTAIVAHFVEFMNSYNNTTQYEHCRLPVYKYYDHFEYSTHANSWAKLEIMTVSARGDYLETNLPPYSHIIPNLTNYFTQNPQNGLIIALNTPSDLTINPTHLITFLKTIQNMSDILLNNTIIMIYKLDTTSNNSNNFNLINSKDLLNCLETQIVEGIDDVTHNSSILTQFMYALMSSDGGKFIQSTIMNKRHKNNTK